VSTFVAICSRNVAIIDSNAGEKLFQHWRFLRSGSVSICFGKGTTSGVAENSDSPSFWVAQRFSAAVKALF
jgi:hypothetical protein